MFARFAIVFLTLTTFLFSFPAHADKELTKLHIESAFNACERAIQMPPPKSQAALRVLQSLHKRYQRYRDKVLKVMPTLPKSEQKYSGEQFVNHSYAEMYKVCETTLLDKIVDAETLIEEKLIARKKRHAAHQAEIEAMHKQIAMALVHVKEAVSTHCLNYLVDPKLKANLQPQYEKEKQAALAAYSNIAKHFFDAIELEPITLEHKRVNKTVKAWFDYCDAGFAGTLEVLQTEEAFPDEEDEDTIDNKGNPDFEGPPLPPGLRGGTSSRDESMDDVEEDDEEATDDDVEYESAKGQATGGKLDTLEEEGRLPDYVNHEDNDIQQANLWQFEEADACILYQFQGDQVSNRQEVKGECPAFE